MCSSRTTLTDEQEQRLLHYIGELVGPDANEEHFREVLLLTLEDISGFEVMSARRARSTTNYFWRIYRDQEARRKHADK